MIKEIQPATDCIFMNSGDYFTDISFSDFLSDNEEVISQNYPTNSKQVTFPPGSGNSNFKNQKTLKTVDRLAHLKISQVFKSPVQAGLMFVDLAQS